MPRHPHPAATTGRLARRVFEALTEAAAAHEGPLTRLSVGDTWMEPFEGARAEAQATDGNPGLHRYSAPPGDPALLEVVQTRLTSWAKRWGRPSVAREDIQVMAGATGGLSICCQALLDPGDEVLLPSPFWPLIRGIIASRGATAVKVPFFTRLSEPGADPEALLEEHVTDRTTAIYLNTPNNPTGLVLTDAQLDAIARVVERHGLWVMSDEVYEDLCFGDPRRPAWCHPVLAERTLATHSVSKSHGLAGARIGWTHGPSDAMKAVKAVAIHQAYCAAKPMQRAAARALTDGDEWLDEARRSHAEAGASAASALGLPVPEAGTFLFFDARPFFRDGEDLLDVLQRCLDAGVLLTPGTASGTHFDTWIRLCFTCVPPDELEEAVRRLRDVLRAG